MEPTTPKPKHQHAEALKLMIYACACGHRETIWNSRDGVTPFATSCSSCGQPKLQHIEWQHDVYAPGHKLHRDQRFWRDGTPDEAEAILHRRFERFAEQGRPVPPDVADRLIASAKGGSVDSEFRVGWPMLDRNT